MSMLSDEFGSRLVQGLSVLEIAMTSFFKIIIDKSSSQLVTVQVPIEHWTEDQALSLLGCYAKKKNKMKF